MLKAIKLVPETLSVVAETLDLDEADVVAMMELHQKIGFVTYIVINTASPVYPLIWREVSAQDLFREYELSTLNSPHQFVPLVKV